MDTKKHIMPHTKTILVVDDDAMTRTVINRFLTEAGYNVVVKCDGVEACRYLKSNESDTDLIISDVMMEYMEGFEFLEKLREKYSSTPVLMISSDDLYLNMATQLGACDVISKPIKGEALIDKVKLLLTSSGRKSALKI